MLALFTASAHVVQPAVGDQKKHTKTKALPDSALISKQFR